MILSCLLLILGLGVLVTCADMLIEAAVRLASKLNISKLAISLTVVALGTSVPETVVSVLSALKGSSIAFSNVLGSNIANTALIMGVALLIGNIKITRNMKNESAKLTLVTGIFILLCIIGRGLNKISGIIMLIILSAYIFSLYKISKQDKQLEKADESEEWIYRLGKRILKNEWRIIVVFIVLGIIGLIVGGDLVVDSAINIAAALNINEGIIGASIIAIGTSLPELVTSIVAMRKKQDDIIIGNVIGSNIINILLILGISSVITPIVATKFEFIQIALLSIITLMFLIFSKTKKKFGKKEGIVLLTLYVVSLIIISIV